MILLGTFVAIQLLGINGGIIFGIVVAIFDYVVTTAQISSATRVIKHSRSVWKPGQWRLLQDHGYHIQHPKIVTIEITGTIFFGSALQLLTSLLEYIGIRVTDEDRAEAIASSASDALSPHHSRMHASPLPSPMASPYSGLRSDLSLRRDRRESDKKKSAPHLKTGELSSKPRCPPRYVVLDLSLVPNLDVSAARGCFLQLAKICAKRSIVICASGAHLRVDWMLRSHDIACTYGIEEEVQAQISNKIILFITLDEALEFCENRLLSELRLYHMSPSQNNSSIMSLSMAGEHSQTTVSSVFSHILGLETKDRKLLDYFDHQGSHAAVQNMQLHSGKLVFAKGDPTDAFYVVLSGTVAVLLDEKGGHGSSKQILSGAGAVEPRAVAREGSDLTDKVGTFLRVGSIFGFCDFVLERARVFGVVAVKDGTVVARVTRSVMDRLRLERPDLERIVEKVLLQTSVLELSNSDF